MKALRIIGIIFGLLVLIAVGAWFALPDKLHVEVSQTLDAPAEDLYAHASNLETWQHWTYWPVRDPTLKWTMGETTQGQGASMRWTGESGSGRLHITAAEPGQRIAYQFFFEDGEDATPADGTMTFTEVDGQTNVTWTMDTALPGFFRFMGIAFQGFVEEDFNEGLARLGAYTQEHPLQPAGTDAPVDSTRSPAGY